MRPFVARFGHHSHCETRPPASRAGNRAASELGSYATRPLDCSICMCPSRLLVRERALGGALMGIWWKLGDPRRESCVSRYDITAPAEADRWTNRCPAPRATGRIATCSVSAKKCLASGSAPSAPQPSAATFSSGMSLGRIQMVKLKLVGLLLREELYRQFPLRKGATADGFKHVAPDESPDPLRRSLPASSQMVDCRPSLGRQWNFANVDLQALLISRKVCTPKHLHHALTNAAESGRT